ncbi:MAG: hypothetical protein KDA42_09995 [Planctomycetales bacterium]|nr:hypothetical protein [Planctomycetales bacterium]
MSAALAVRPSATHAQVAGQRPSQDASVEVLNPRTRVPLSFIIDDSTCLVNLNRFAIPQFARLAPERYQHDWRKMPVEIPDDFVRKFVDWCDEHGVKGKYSVVPYPACVGRLDRVLPGWTHKEMAASLDLVRTRLLPNWDIHPEMVTHTRVIDTKTGHPLSEVNSRTMENWRWAEGKSVDELANYLSYALRILKNVDLPCQGITTPGGFGNGAKPELAQAAFEAVRDVFDAEIPHYFKYLEDSGSASVQPRVEYASGLDTDDPRCIVNLIACTGDWTGGWDCSNRGDLDRFITPDLAGGRMVDVIDRGEPALMLCHWTGIYFNGEEVGLRIFQEAVTRLERKYDHLSWMKLSEIARYWAAKELTRIERTQNRIELHAPYACPDFTLRLVTAGNAAPQISRGDSSAPLREVARRFDLQAGAWRREGNDAVICFNLPKGRTQILC